MESLTFHVAAPHGSVERITLAVTVGIVFNASSLEDISPGWKPRGYLRLLRRSNELLAVTGFLYRLSAPIF